MPAQIKPNSFESRRNSFFNSGRMCLCLRGCFDAMLHPQSFSSQAFRRALTVSVDRWAMWHSRTPCCIACFPCGVVVLASPGSRRLTTCTVFALTTRPLPPQNISFLWLHDLCHHKIYLSSDYTTLATTKYIFALTILPLPPQNISLL